jgi:hypothetical protein
MMDDMGVDFPFYFFALVGVREFVTGRYTIFIKGVYKRRMDGWLDGHTDGGRESIDTYPGILCLLLDGLFIFNFSFLFLFFSSLFSFLSTMYEFWHRAWFCHFKSLFSPNSDMLPSAFDGA